MFLPFRFSPYSFDCYIFLIILLIESSFSINFLNILYHFFNWIIFSIASLNILVHFILCQIWVLFSWLIFILFLILSYWNFFFLFCSSTFHLLEFCWPFGSRVWKIGLGLFRYFFLSGYFLQLTFFFYHFIGLSWYFF